MNDTQCSIINNQATQSLIFLFWLIKCDKWEIMTTLLSTVVLCLRNKVKPHNKLQHSSFKI